MSYGDFTLAKVKKELGIEIVEGVSLFGEVAPIVPSPFLIEALRRHANVWLKWSLHRFLTIAKVKRSIPFTVQ